jgi:hypothetical protein
MKNEGKECTTITTITHTTPEPACAMDLSLGFVLVLTLALDIASTPSLPPLKESNGQKSSTDEHEPQQQHKCTGGLPHDTTILRT